MRNRTVRRLTVVVTVACATLALASPAWAQSFTKGTEVRVDTFAPDVDVADVNGDGELDALVGAHNNAPGYVRILAGQGDGSFGSGISHQTVTYPGGLAAGDINGDGHKDLVYAANSGSRGSLSVDLGDGTGSFVHSTSVVVGGNPDDIALADLDGNGFKDVIVASAWSDASTAGIEANGTIAVIRNNNGALETQRTRYELGNSLGEVSVGDADGDGDPDIAVGRYGGDVALLTNTGTNSGNFSASYPSTGNDQAVGVVLADFDGDGDADLATGNANNTGGLGVALGDGSGGYGQPTMVERLNGLRSLRAADFDDDGDTDLAAIRSSENPNAVFVYANNGSGVFSRASSIVPNQNSGLYEDFAVGAFNDDRYPDLLALRSNPDAGIIPLLADPPPNVAPVISSAEVTPQSPRPDGTLTASVSASDPNRDPVTLAYRWELKNPQTGAFEAIGNETGGTLDLSKAGIGEPGDVIRAAVTATDSRGLATSRNSNEVTVIDPRAIISVSASNLAFDPRAVGSIGPTRALTVTNAGSADPLNVGGIRRSGPNPDDFVVNGDDCTAGPIPAGESCRIGVRFAPEAAGPRTATLSIFGDAAGGPAEATLSGTGRLVAQNDSYATGGGETLSVPAPGVLGNDTEEIPLKALRVEGPNDGSLSLNEDGSFEYVPDAGFDGTDSFTYRAADGTGPEANRSSEALVTILVRPAEGPALDTKILDAPGARSNSPSAAFSFSSPEPDATFECSLDGADFTPCDAPKEYTNLGEGQHDFRVRAVDAAGNVDPSPATSSWEVDTTAPTVQGVSPRNGAKAVPRGTDVSVLFSEAMDEASVERADALTLRERGSVKFVPATRSYGPATNSLTLEPSRALKPGATYVARVRFLATDEAGNDLREITTWTFTVRR